MNKFQSAHVEDASVALDNTQRREGKKKKSINS